MVEERLSKLIEDFNYRNLNLFFRSKCENYAEAPEDLSLYDDERFRDFQKLGEIRFDIGDKLVITSSLVSGDLSERSGKKAQYEKAKKILKDQQIYDAGFFIFHDDSGSFRFSLIYAQFQGVKRTFSNFRRYTYFVSPKEPYRTFLIRVGDCNYSSLETIKDAFSVEKVNKEFYGHIARFFYRLTGYNHPREMKLPSVPDEDKKTYQEFAVRLIGRAIFCWFLKHKRSPNGESLIPESILSSEAVRQNSQYYHSVLEKLFFEVLNTQIKERKGDIFDNADKIPFLNGGLFEPHKDDFNEPSLINALKIPDEWFEQFFEILEQYNFTIDENSTIDADVSIDPEMLGRIFENLLAEVNPETGETARKATGSYYTPRTIIDYMVDQSLKQYLTMKTNISEDQIASLLSYEAEDVRLTDAEKDSVISALDEIKIIDPACGSGAFPMGILHKMLLVLQKVDPDLRIWLRNHLSKIEPGIFRDRLLERIENENWEYVRKLLIIQKSIYGVDIQTIAVEISKLRFFLSLIVDEKIEDAKENRGVEALPNLEFKFVAANTLIALPSLINRQVGLGVSEEITRLKELRNSYLRSYGKDKKKIEEDFLQTRGKLIAHNVDWGGKDALALQLANWNPFSNEACEWFDPEWMFGVSDGFDIVIANPPYISYYSRQAKKIDRTTIEYYQRRYSFLKNSRKKSINTVMLFLEKAFDVLALNATVAYIIDIGFFEKVYKEIRKYISQFNICEIVANLSVFEKVASGQLVIICKKENVPNFKCIVKNDFQATNVFLSREDFSKDTVNISFLEKDALGDMKAVIPLGRISRITCGIEYGALRDMFLSSEKRDERYHRVVNGGISLPLKYCLRWNKAKNGYVLFDKHYEQELARKGLNVSKTGKVVHLISGDEEKYKEEKLLIRQSATEIVGAFDDQEYYALRSLFVCNLTDPRFNLKYILALLNSKLITYYSQANGVIRYVKGKQPQIRVEGLKSIPIKKLQKSDQKPFIEIVERIQEITRSDDYLNKSDEKAKVEDYMKRIDQIVYELYGLTPEEIEIVKGKSESR